MTFTPGSAGFAYWGGTGSVRVDVANGCGWSVTTTPAWVRPYVAQGTGSGTVYFQVQAQPYGSATRSGFLVVNGAAFAVAQSGTVTAPTVTVVSTPTPPAPAPTPTPTPTAPPPAPTAPPPTATPVAPAAGLCSVSFTPVEGRFTWTGGYAGLSISAAASCSWSVSSMPSWVRLHSASSGSGSRTLLYHVPYRWGEASDRSGAIVVNGRSFLVHQSR